MSIFVFNYHPYWYCCFFFEIVQKFGEQNSSVTEMKLINLSMTHNEINCPHGGRKLSISFYLFKIFTLLHMKYAFPGKKKQNKKKTTNVGNSLR